MNFNYPAWLGVVTLILWICIILFLLVRVGPKVMKEIHNFKPTRKEKYQIVSGLIIGGGGGHLLVQFLPNIVSIIMGGIGIGVILGIREFKKYIEIKKD